jgi:hypothetical protein
VANSSSVQPWSLSMPLGSLQQWLFTFSTINSITGQSVPYPIAGATWEYVVRATPTSGGTALISFGTAATSQGVLVVMPGSGSTASTVQLNIYPRATQGLAPSTYSHALWMGASAGSASASATTWWSGPLIIEGNPQP